jgi:hypothetical protein
MLGGMEVFGGVPIGRLVATADMPAGAANSQVNPMTTRLQTLLATLCARMDAPDARRVGTSGAHDDSRLLIWLLAESSVTRPWDHRSTAHDATLI